MKKICTINGCERIHMSKGLCKMHYSRLKRNGDVGQAKPLINIIAKPIRLCSIDNCNREHDSLGLCSMHHSRLKRTGNVGSVESTKDMPPKKCNVDGCSRKHSAHGYCNTHNRRIKISGTPGGSETLVSLYPEHCSIDGCNNKYFSSGHCQMHYNRVYRGGDTGAIEKTKALNGEGTISEGYRFLYIDGKRISEHRYKVEQYIGRKLLLAENIHHRNGDRLDNTVGDCVFSYTCNCSGSIRHNLEFWGTKQPQGQRLIDKYMWAKDIIKQYEKELETNIDLHEWFNKYCC